MSHILAIDQGTSGTKALVFDQTGQVHARGFAPVTCTTPRAGFVEQDTNALYASVLKAVDECLSGFKGDIAGIGISNQRETVVLWNAKGEPIAPGVSWQCQRSLGICERLKRDGLQPLIAQKTGLLIDPYFQAPNSSGSTRTMNACARISRQATRTSARSIAGCCIG